MVLIHGGGGTAFDDWVRLWVGRGYAAIAMDTCGQVPVGNYGQYLHDPQSGPPGWGGFDQIDQPQRDQWTYHAVADAILAHSLIRSLPEVDPERIGVTGISWGGYLTCIVAGIDSRFKLAIPVYGCGFYQETVFEQPIQMLGPERANRWMTWWDPSVYLGNASMPMLWVTGSNDFAYPLGALQSSYRLPTGPRTMSVRLRMSHGHGGAGENPEEIRVFADTILKDGMSLPVITGTGRDGALAWATFTSASRVVNAVLNFTLDEGAWQDRKWETLPATLSDGRIVAELPADTKVYYFNLTDQRDCVVSTEHENNDGVGPYGGYRSTPYRFGFNESRMGKALMNPTHQAALHEGAFTQQDLDRIILWLDLNAMRLARPTKDKDQLHLQEYGGDFIWPDEIDRSNPTGVEHDRPLPR